MNDTKAEAEAVEKILELQELERREREPGPGGMVKHKQLWGEASEETGQLGWGETVAGRLNMLTLASMTQAPEPHELSEEPPELVLQTRTVPVQVVYEQIEDWKSAMSDELNQLTVVHQAVKVVGEAELKTLEDQGIVVQRIPGKVVCTVKPPHGKKKCRLVACGNYLGTQHQAEKGMNDPTSPTLQRRDLYAGGLDPLSLRLMLRYAAGRLWSAAVLDVKTAFLLAPARGKERRRVAVRSPAVMIRADLLPALSYLLVEQALYGLDTSPSDWAIYRDGRLKKITWRSVEGVARHLKQCVSDQSVWLIVTGEPAEDAGEPARMVEPDTSFETEFKQACHDFDEKSGGFRSNVWEGPKGIVGVYVDDVVAVSSPEELREFTKAIRELWQTSEPEFLFEKRELRFCGMQLECSGEGAFLLHQKDYLKDLLSKYPSLPKSGGVPMGQDGPPEEVEAVDIPTLRKAQKLVGEALWLAGRTRVDIAYTVSRLGQWVSKHPGYVYTQGQRLLAYLNESQGYRLRFGGFDEPWPAEPGLRITRSIRTIESWSDASFGIDEGRSQSGIAVIVAGGTVAWLSLRQPFATLSTAESELIAAVESLTLTQSLMPLWKEIVRQEIEWTSLVDNQAGVQLLSFPAGSWRTRHLRLRAYAFHQLVEQEQLLPHHIPGEVQVADALTKALQSQRLKMLLNLLGWVYHEMCAPEEINPGRESVTGPPDPPRGSKHVPSLDVGTPPAAQVLLAVLLADMIAKASSSKASPDSFLGGSERLFEGWELGVFGVLVVLCWEALKLLVRWSCRRCCPTVVRRESEKPGPRSLPELEKAWWTTKGSVIHLTESCFALKTTPKASMSSAAFCKICLKKHKLK